MKAKTIIEKKIAKYSKSLPKLTINHINLIRKEADFYYSISRNKAYCLECGHKNSIESFGILEDKGFAMCPSCNTFLKFKEGYNKESMYIGKLSIYKGYQILRIFLYTKYFGKGKAKVDYTQEVMQHFISIKGKRYFLAKAVNGLSYYSDVWIQGSEMTFKKNCGHKMACNKSIAPYYLLPNMRILPILKRNGFANEFNHLHPIDLFQGLLCHSEFEFLWKVGQYDLCYHMIKYYSTSKTKEYWKSIKVCVRNNYLIKDVNMWFDLLFLLKELNKDILNPYYICPEDVKKAHDHYLKKKKEITRKLKIKKLRDNINEANINYIEKIKPFKDLVISKGNIEITPLLNVEEFLIEGDTLEHCIFENEYYNRKESLMLSAKIDNIRTETIEIDLTTTKIKQCGGLQNTSSIYQEDIKTLINKNLKKIKIISKQLNTLT